MKDLTTGNEYHALFYFSLPILIGNLFQQLYNVADSMIVGKLLGIKNLAAVGFCFQISLILTALSMGLSLGASILISRYFGAKKHQAIRPVIETSLLFCAVLSVFVSLAGIKLSEPIIKLFRVPADTADLAFIYLRILFMGAIPVFLYNTITNILRGLGDSKSPVYFLAGSVLLNICLDLLFIGTFRMGIAGAAYATITAQAVSFFGIFLYMHVAYPSFRPRLKNPEFRFDILKACLKIGIPSMAQQLFKSIGFMTLQGMVNGFGSSCMAAYAIVSKIDSFAQLPALNLGQALSNFTAQNLGAKKEARAKKGLRTALLMGVSMTIAISFLVVPLPDLLIRMFTNDDAVLSIGRSYLRIVGLFYCIDAVMQMLNGALLGYGRVLIPMVSTIVSLCLMQVPAAFFLSSTSLGYVGIWMAAPFGWMGGVLIRYYYYRKIAAPPPEH